MTILTERSLVCRLWTPGEKPNKPCERSKYLDKVDFKGEFGNWAVWVKIPRIYLHGTQPHDNYANTKRKIIETRFKKCGAKECLRENPIAVCAIPLHGNQIMAVIIDGHHKGRSSGNYDINAIPSLVYTPDQVAEIHRLKGLEPVTASEVIEKFIMGAETTIRSFPEIPPFKQPRIIKGVSNPQDLLSIFPSF